MPIDWDKPVFGVPLKYAVPIGLAAVLGAGAYFWWRSRSSANSTSTSTTAPTTISGADLSSSGLTPYFGTGAPTAGQTSTPIPMPEWQYGNPPSDPNQYVWKPTGVNSPSGIDTNQVFPGSAGNPANNSQSYPGFGQYSWQWAPVPQGWNAQTYAQALTAAFESGGLFTGPLSGTLSGLPAAVPSFTTTPTTTETPPPSAPQPSTPPPAPTPTPAPSPAQTVTVGHWPAWSGSLWGIAQHFTGSGTNWPALYNLNKSVIGSNPNLIYPGTILKLPSGW